SRLDRRPGPDRRAGAGDRPAHGALPAGRPRPRDHGRCRLALLSRGREPCRNSRLAGRMIAWPLLALAALAAGAQPARPPAWTLANARHVLADGDFVVKDMSQTDQPSYHLVFTRREAAALRPSGKRADGRWRTFTFRGVGHDGFTDADVSVRFTLSPRDGLIGFRGPPADTSQPALPIRAAFYYAWYPEAWTRDSIFPYSIFHPSLGFYDTDQATVARRETEAMRYARLGPGLY